MAPGDWEADQRRAQEQADREAQADAEAALVRLNRLRWIAEAERDASKRSEAMRRLEEELRRLGARDDD